MNSHHAAEFFSVVKSQYDRSTKIYEKNCREKEYAPSCFNLARAYCKWLLVVCVLLKNLLCDQTKILSQWLEGALFKVTQQRKLSSVLFVCARNRYVIIDYYNAIEKACEGGHLVACHHHGTLLYELVIKPPPVTDIKRPVWNEDIPKLVSEIDFYFRKILWWRRQ